MPKKPLLGAVLLYIAAATAALYHYQPTSTAQVTLGTTGLYEPFAFESVTVGTTAVALTQATYAPGEGQVSARRAFCTNETDSIRYRIDGTANPTSSVGHSVAAGGSLTLYTAEISRARFIRSGSGDATLRCTYAR